MRPVSHNVIKKYFQKIANEHKQIHDFSTFNLNAARERLRSGLKTPIFLLESHSSDIEGGRTSTFNVRTVSFLIMDHVPRNDFEREDEIKNESEQITLDILSRMHRDGNNPEHWLYGLFDKNSVSSDTPPEFLFGDMMGYNTRLEIKNHEPLTFDPDKWEIVEE